MTETEWNDCIDPASMLQFVRGKVSDRKLRLFMLDCCRRIRHLLSDKSYCYVVDIAERFADGLADSSELAAARVIPEQVAWWGDTAGSIAPMWLAGWFTDPYIGAQANASEPDAAVVLALAVTEEDAHAAAEHLCVPWGMALGVEPAAMASVLRDVVHAPYRGVIMRASWRTWNGGITRKLAQAIYDERVFDRLPILADALEEAGCSDVDILDHCRQPGEHVRGCWVVDLLLGKQ